MGFYIIEKDENEIETEVQKLGFTTVNNVAYLNIDGIITARKGGQIGGLSILDDGTLGSPYLTLGVDKNENTVFAIKNKAGKGLMSLTANTDGEYLLNIEGYINALGGKIGGFTINKDNLSSDYMLLAGNQFALYDKPLGNSNRSALLQFVNTGTDDVPNYTLAIKGNIEATSLIAREGEKGYFKVDNSTMGFFDTSNTPMLYYDGAHMTLNGNIYAAGGTIGGFTINSDNLSNSDDTIKLSGANGEVDFGKGIISFTPQNDTIMAVYNKSPNSNPEEEDNRRSLLEIHSTGSEGDTDPEYELSISGLKLVENSIPIEAIYGLEDKLNSMTENIITKYDGIITKKSDFDNEKLVNLSNGTIVLSYKLKDDVANTTQVSSGAEITPPAKSSYTEYKKHTYNGIRLFSWNCPGGSGSQGAGTSLLQVGSGSSDVQYGTRLKIRFTAGTEKIVIPSFSLSFYYMNSNGTDDLKPSERRSSTIKVFENDTSTVVKDKKTFTLKGANYSQATFDFASTETMSYYTNTDYYLILSSTNTYSRFWICNSTDYRIDLTANDIPSSDAIIPTLWTKSGGKWYKMASGVEAPTT